VIGDLASPAVTGTDPDRTAARPAVSDGAVSDGAVTDGAVSDGAVTDGAVTDGAVSPPVRLRGRRRRTRSRRRRILLAMLFAFLAMVGVTAGGAIVLVNQLESHVGRISGAFDRIDQGSRPAKPATAASSLNFLMVGADSDTDPGSVNGAGGRSDALMLAHLSADRSRMTVISLPRDSWVDIPGRGKLKINAAYALGGPSLAIWTVEQLTGVRIDHFAAIDFRGFRSMVDAIGGVDVEVGYDALGADDIQLHAGTNHLNGNTALAYVRERHSLPQGDLDRVRRQQNLIRAVLAKAATKDPIQNPVELYHLVDAATRSISVDDGLSDSDLRSLALTLLQISGGNTAFLTAPVRGTGWEGDQSVVYLDEVGCAELWHAVANDATASYLDNHRDAQLPAVPR